MRSAFTIATGPQSYKRMAVNCALSFCRWNRLPFVIYSDEPLALPKAAVNVEVRLLQEDRFGRGFSTKLHIDSFAPTSNALFIDADCLVMGNLERLFEIFEGTPVGVLGYSKADGEMFGDVAEICRRVGVRTLPHFNGGVYYVEVGDVSAGVLAEARRLEPEYDSLGIVRLRGQPNDEMLIGIAMAKAGIEPIHNDGSLYADFQWWPKVEAMDALNGVARMRNPPLGQAGHQDRFPADVASPLIVHFLGHHVEGTRYRREAFALRLPFSRGIARLIANLAYLPHVAIDRLRGAARPLFHAVIGVRQVRRSKSRLIIE